MFTNNYLTFQKKRFLFLTDINNAINSYVNLKHVENGNAKWYPVHSATLEVGGWMGKGRCKEIVTSETCYPNDSGKAGVYFGTGTTPPTLNDYKLESPITSGLKITNPDSLITKQEGDIYKFSAPMIVSNTTETDVTISEMGVFVPVPNAEYNGKLYNSQTVYYVLMERRVLSEPITIPAGGSKLVTYEITFNQVLNVE